MESSLDLRVITRCTLPCTLSKLTAHVKGDSAVACMRFHSNRFSGISTIFRKIQKETTSKSMLTTTTNTDRLKPGQTQMCKLPAANHMLL